MKPAIASAALVACLALSGPAEAWQKFEDYRILGTELQGVKAVDPAFEEDPAVLELLVGAEGETPVTLELETDGFLEDCAQTLEYVIGDPNAYAQIVVQVNADTMNGSLIIQCSAISLR